MNKKQRQKIAKQWIITIMKREQFEGLCEEFGEDEGIAIHDEVMAIIKKLEQSIRKDSKT